jgi:DNA-binding MarR family transcriptional regulator
MSQERTSENDLEGFVYELINKVVDMESLVHEQLISKFVKTSETFISLLKYVASLDRDSELMDIVVRASAEQGMNPLAIMRYLGIAEECGYVEKQVDEDGTSLYRITKKGKEIADNINSDDVERYIRSLFLSISEYLAENRD